MKQIGTFFLTMVCFVAMGQQKNTAALSTLFAYDGTYNKILLTEKKHPKGVTSDFNDMYATMVSNFSDPNIGAANPASIQQFYFALTSATTARVHIQFYIKSNNSSNPAWADYDYTISGDVITLSAEKKNSLYWRVNRNLDIGAMKDYFSGKSFKIDWVEDTSGNKTLGGLYPVDNLSNFFYGQLTK